MRGSSSAADRAYIEAAQAAWGLGALFRRLRACWRKRSASLPASQSYGYWVDAAARDAFLLIALFLWTAIPLLVAAFSEGSLEYAGALLTANNLQGGCAPGPLRRQRGRVPGWRGFESISREAALERSLQQPADHASWRSQFVAGACAAAAAAVPPPRDPAPAGVHPARAQWGRS